MKIFDLFGMWDGGGVCGLELVFRYLNILNSSIKGEINYIVIKCRFVG